MDRQNVTLSLPKLLLKKAKILAASEDRSLSEFLRETLEEKIKESNGYTRAKIRQVKTIKKGFDRGTKGMITISRQESHTGR